MKNKFRYFIITLIICFVISACCKESGPYPDLYLITNFKVIDNCCDTNCIIKWDNFEIHFRFNGILALENVNLNNIDLFYIYKYYYYFKSINIYTINYYNSKYPANSCVTKLFDEDREYRYLGYNDFVSISNPNSNIICDLNFFILNEPPENNSEQRFIIEIDNGAGEIFRDTTRSIYLTIE